MELEQNTAISVLLVTSQNLLKQALKAMKENETTFGEDHENVESGVIEAVHSINKALYFIVEYVKQ